MYLHIYNVLPLSLYQIMNCVTFIPLLHNDIIGYDIYYSFVLGHILNTLGTVLQCAAHTPPLLPMATALLDFCWTLKHHSDTYVSAWTSHITLSMCALVCCNCYVTVVSGEVCCTACVVCYQPHHCSILN